MYLCGALQQNYHSFSMKLPSIKAQEYRTYSDNILLWCIIVVVVKEISWSWQSAKYNNGALFIMFIKLLHAYKSVLVIQCYYIQAANIDSIIMGMHII